MDVSGAREYLALKNVTVDLAVDTVSFVVDVVEHLRQIYVEAID